VTLRSLSHKVHTSVVRFFDSGRNLLFQTAQSELRTCSVSIYIASNKSEFLHKYVMHIPEEWGIINAGDNWEGMLFKKLNLHSQ
jgi:hypothetical protein